MANEKDTTDTTPEVKKSNPSFRSTRILTLAALALGLLFDILFDGHPPGISVPIWSLACIVTLLEAAKSENVQPSKPELVLPLGIIVLSVFSSIRLEPMSGLLCVFLILLLFGIWIFAFRIGRVLDFGWLDFLVASVRTPLESLFHPWPVASAAWRESIGPRNARSYLLATLRGLLLALPVFLIFLGLLVRADLVFADRVKDALQWMDIDLLMQIIRRVFVIFFATIFSLGAIVMALRRREGRTLIGYEKPILAPFLGFIESTVVLVLIDLLLTAFVAIQFAYLFGGEANITTTGYTYSEYARRGFFELTFLAILGLGLIMSLATWTKRDSLPMKRWFNTLSTCLVGLMGIILVSAMKRLLLYEGAYGFTRLRTYTHVAIVWIGVMFVVLLVLLFRDRLRRFAPAAALGVFGFTLTLNLLNVDAFIVRQNLYHHNRAGEFEIIAAPDTQRTDTPRKIDLAYLFGLSTDAIPGLVDFVDEASGDTRVELVSQLACERKILETRMKRLKWPSTHFSLIRAQMALDKIAETLDEYPIAYGRSGWLVYVDGEPMQCNHDFFWD